ncbi:3-sulfolactaldehyde reductase [Streptomyces cyaneofuscatus]
MTTTTMTVAFIGLGRHGRPDGRHLVKAGHRVLGHDLVETSLATAVERGVGRAKSAADAAAVADVVITMLPAGRHVLSLYGQEGLLEAARPGTLFVYCRHRRGRARWAQSCRSQIRQPSPMGVTDRGSSRARPSAYTSRWAWRSSQPRATAKSARGARCPNPPRVTARVTQKYLLPSGISATWVRMRPGAENASYTVQSGQVPPSREKWKSLAGRARATRT